MIASQADKFKGKVTYDIEKSGLGFMLAVQDSQADANYFYRLQYRQKAALTVQSSTGTMMERVSSGENLIGYNILGSYAEARAKNDPLWGIAYPKDYVLVLSRVSFISQRERTSQCGKIAWTTVLSEKASRSRQSGGYSSIRRDIEGKNDIDGMTALLGSVKTDPGQRNAAGLFTAAKTSAVY